MSGQMIQTISRVNLVIGALILAAYGVVFFARPSALGGLVGLEFTSPDAPVEIRAFYGGLELGIAGFLLACARDPKLLSAGLLFMAIAFSFAGAARVLGVLQYGVAGSAHLVVAGVELFAAAVSAWLRTREAP